MDSLSIWLASGLALSVCANAWLITGYWGHLKVVRDLKVGHEHAMADLKAKATGEPTYDCRLLLHDLTSGSGAVKITRLDPNELYVRRT